MANFSNEIEKIMNGKGNKAIKVEALIQTGLMPNEAEMVYKMFTPASVTHRESFSYTYGVEIECLYNREVTTQKLREMGIEFSIEGYGHTNNNKDIKLKRDGSLHVDSVSDRLGLSCIEAVTPVLKGNKFEDLKKLCSALNAGGARNNKTTGLHVHIGANFTEEQYINVFKNYQALEMVIDSFMPVSRRLNNNTYCATLIDHCFSHCTDIASVRRELSNDRYHKVNPCSYSMHRTIEFRQHSGTCDFEKIKNWVSFCAKLVQFSKHNVFDREVDSVDDIPFLSKAEKAFYNARVIELRRA